MRKLPYMGMIFVLMIGVLLVIPAAIFGLCTLFDFRLRSGEIDPAHLTLSYENAPEGTVRIEPLIRLDSADNGYIPTSQDSELALLNDNGYVSLSLHYAHCENGGDWLRLPGETPEELQKRYGAFRAAYVDESGNVLGVTKPARYSYGSSKLRGLKSGRQPSDV